MYFTCGFPSVTTHSYPWKALFFWVGQEENILGVAHLKSGKYPGSIDDSGLLQDPQVIFF